MPDDKAIQEAITALQSALAAGKNDPQEIHIGHQVYKGTPMEVVGELIKAQSHATEALHTSKETLTERERTIQALTQSLQEKTTPSAKTNGTGYDDKKYWELAADDPIKAERYRLSYVLFDGKIQPDELPRAVERMDRVVTYVEDLGEVQKFLTRHPEFPAGEAGELVFDEIKKSGQDWSAETIEHQYLRLKEEGKIKPLSAEEVAQITGQQPQKLVPPTLTTGGAGGGQKGYTEGDLMSMPREEFDKLVAQGVFRKQ